MRTKKTGPSGTESPRLLENFVVLEGLDGAGTTTQLHLLELRLSQTGVPHFCTGEPTQGPVGRLLRSILKRELAVNPCTVALLFAADRNEHLYDPAQGILAHLERRELVISDRYLFSSLAYQSLGCPAGYVEQLNRLFPLPATVLFIDTPVTLSQDRLAVRGGASQELFDGPEIQQDILAGYRRAFALFRDSGMVVHHLDGGLSPEEVFGFVWKLLLGLPMLRG